MTGVRSLSALALAVALAMSAPPVEAQDARLLNDVDTTQITVGGRIRLSVTVEHAAGAQVVWPDSLDLAPFEVLRAEASPPSAQGDRVRSGAVLTLTAFELGALEIPAFDIQVVGPGDAREELSTDRFGVEVVSVGVDEAGDIRDIRGPLWIPVGVLRVSMWLLAGLAALALATWLWRRRKPRTEAATVVVGPPPRPAHEIALEALAGIESSTMLPDGQVKEYHIAVSEALRSFVEARFEVMALEMTTREVVTGLERARIDGDFIRGLRRFLDRCDMVKFAKVRPTESASTDTLALGRQLVLSTLGDPAGTAEDGGEEGAAGQDAATEAADAPSAAHPAENDAVTP